MQAPCLGLVCRECGKLVPEAKFVLTCPDCGAPMRVVFDPAGLARALADGLPAPAGRSALHQWRNILPISDMALIPRVSLGEGETQLLPSRRMGARLGLRDLRFKVEQGPTLSLKDRGTSLCVLKALEFGRRTVCVASSGNNAASVSAYGARAGLEAVVFVQKQVSPAKVCKSVVYGGRVVRIDGDMATASRICNEMVERHHWFQCGGPNPYRIVAKRTFAYGIVQQLGMAPDVLLIPCGGGAGLVAAHDAFTEMLAAGVITRLPRLVGVQLEACDPIARAFHAGEDTVRPVEKKPSRSDAIMNANPYWGRYCLKAVRETGGTMISVSDEEFIRTIREMGREEGIFAEPAGAASVAALAKLVKLPEFASPGVTVCNITGHGLNAPTVATSEEDFPDVTAPTVEAVEAALRGRP
ncbi:MAG: threonine synthase [Desulfovibrio sp.]|nr:threonine synthase [Desulfovibrio sp.]